MRPESSGCRAERPARSCSRVRGDDGGLEAGGRLSRRSCSLATIRRSTRRSPPMRRRGCRRSTSRRSRASCCTSSPAWPAPAASSRSARSAAIRRSGSPARCPPDGRLVTLEAEPRHAEVARANIARAGLADRVEVRRRPGARHAAGASRPVRPRLHRRRQARATPTISPGRCACRAPAPSSSATTSSATARIADAASRDPGVVGTRALLRPARRRAAPDRHRDPDRRRQGLGRLRHRHRGLIPVRCPH